MALLRFADFALAVRDRYPSTGTPPEWLIGAEHASDHHNWNRIVAWFSDARVVPPRHGANSRTDRVVLSRIVRAHFGLWVSANAPADPDDPEAAPVFASQHAEDVVHALLEAIDWVAGGCDLTIADVRELWSPPIGDVLSGGVLVDVSFDLVINVLESDRKVITDAAIPGAGTPATPAESLTLTGDHDDDDGPAVEWTAPYPGDE